MMNANTYNLILIDFFQYSECRKKHVHFYIFTHMQIIKVFRKFCLILDFVDFFADHFGKKAF